MVLGSLTHKPLGINVSQILSGNKIEAVQLLIFSLHTPLITAFYL